MNKRQWTYMSDQGEHTQIGMLHQPLTGHLLVYCGKNVALAEFNVFETASFSFFFNEELCKVHIIKAGNEFQYNLEIVKDVDTPLNRERQKEQKQRKKRNYFGIGMGIASLAVAGLILFAVIRIHQNHLRGLRESNGDYATATILISKQPSSYALSYVFGTKSKTLFRPIEYYATPNPISPNGFPFVQQDEFLVHYENNNPDNHEVQYSKPTEKQLKVYHNRTRKVHFEQHPDITDTTYCDCLIQSAYDLKQLDGYLHFYYQKRAPSQNTKYNIKTYIEFTQTKAFQEKAKVCEANLTTRLNNHLDSLSNLTIEEDNLIESYN